MRAFGWGKSVYFYITKAPKKFKRNFRNLGNKKGAVPKDQKFIEQKKASKAFYCFLLETIREENCSTLKTDVIT